MLRVNPALDRPERVNRVLSARLPLVIRERITVIRADVFDDVVKFDDQVSKWNLAPGWFWLIGWRSVLVLCFCLVHNFSFYCQIPASFLARWGGLQCRGEG